MQCLFLSGKGMDHQKIPDPFLQKHPQTSVRFLDPLMKHFEPPAEKPGKQHQHNAPGNQDRRKNRFQHYDHDKRTDELYYHTGKSRQNVNIGICNDLGITRQTVEPFPGMNSTDPQEIAVQQCIHQTSLEDVFKC